MIITFKSKNIKIYIINREKLFFENELNQLKEYYDVYVTGYVKKGEIFSENEMIEILQSKV